MSYFAVMWKLMDIIFQNKKIFNIELKKTNLIINIKIKINNFIFIFIFFLIIIIINIKNYLVIIIKY